MLIITLYAKMSEYTEKTIVINRPMSLSFHILHSQSRRRVRAGMTLFRPITKNNHALRQIFLSHEAMMIPASRL